MEPTPLAEITLPAHVAEELATRDVSDWINNHAIEVKPRWWNEALAAQNLPGISFGDTIRRGDIFTLAESAQTDPDAALTLLWTSLAWGSGTRRRNNKRRIKSVAADKTWAGEHLMKAATLSREDPAKAYAWLYPDHRGAIPWLGPAFFTKYLYFAGGGSAEHPCVILDVNVARALHESCGWKSLPVEKGGWNATAYGNYCKLLGGWVDQPYGIARRDVIERWLFEEGKRLAPQPKRRQRTAR